MRFINKPAHKILQDWTDEGRYAVAFPCYWDGGEAVICRSFQLGEAAATLAYHRAGIIRALFAIQLLQACKQDIRQKADADGVHLAL